MEEESIERDEWKERAFQVRWKPHVRETPMNIQG